MKLYSIAIFRFDPETIAPVCLCYAADVDSFSFFQKNG